MALNHALNIQFSLVLDSESAAKAESMNYMEISMTNKFITFSTGLHARNRQCTGPLCSCYAGLSWPPAEKKGGLPTEVQYR